MPRASREPSAATTRDVLLTGQLRSALERLNPSLPTEAVEEAFRKVVNLPHLHPGLAANNRAFHKMLSSLLAYHNGNLDPVFMQSLIEMRLTVETETARLAALNRTPEQLAEFRALLAEEEKAACGGPQTLTELDFSFHLSIAIASGNLVYPLIINSFKGVYTHLTGEFFRKYCGTPVVETVRQFHIQLVGAFEKQDGESAVRIMTEKLKHGEIYLKGERP